MPHIQRVMLQVYITRNIISKPKANNITFYSVDQRTEIVINDTNCISYLVIELNIVFSKIELKVKLIS